MITKTFLAATTAATVAFCAFSAPAFAAPAADDAEVSVAVVRTADLNLTSDEGQATLKARIAGAVTQVCGTNTGTISLEERLAINACRAKARNAALAAARSRNDQVLARR
jgi:UrcA family protein